MTNDLEGMSQEELEIVKKEEESTRQNPLRYYQVCSALGLEQDAVRFPELFLKGRRQQPRTEREIEQDIEHYAQENVEKDRMKEQNKEDIELIEEFRGYDEDKDPGGHKLANLIKELSKKAKSSSPAAITIWATKREGEIYGSSSLTILPEDKENNSDATEDSSEELRLERTKYMKQVIAKATNPEDKAFLERLLSSSYSPHSAQ
jgi:hypothetical protein